MNDVLDTNFTRTHIQFLSRLTFCHIQKWRPFCSIEPIQEVFVNFELMENIFFIIKQHFVKN